MPDAGHFYYKPDPKKGHRIDQAKVAELVAKQWGGRPITTQTVRNWMGRGLNGVVLPSAKLLKFARFTSVESLQWFLQQVDLTNESKQQSTLPNLDPEAVTV